ncbi:MAG: carboxylesterase family protein [Lachnospiraceae bacterium]
MVPQRFWSISEHCQNLNIWTPSIDPEAKKPVMVWFHGGGFSAVVPHSFIPMRAGR